MQKQLLALLTALAVAPVAGAVTRLDIPMTISGSQVTDVVSGRTFNVEGNIGPMQIAGPDGQAWRTDGYTTSIGGDAGSVLEGDRMTAQVAFAIDTNAIVGHDRADANGEWATFVDCTDGASGFAFMLGRSGQFAFRTYVGGREVVLQSDVNSAEGKLQLWQWNNLAGVVDGNRVAMYLNGRLVAETHTDGTGVKVGGTILLGRDRYHNDLYALARQADFNGAIDYLRISDDVQVPQYAPAYADLNLPADRYNADPLRARYHGQPGMNWTNETHGLMYNEADGKYHVIFQRTGSAPVMSHAHYGHIVSDNLFDWRDDKPMIWPSEDYDRRGCWSGCIFTDPQINGGKPTIIYTGVEYGSVSHACIAYCDDPVSLRSWHKPAAQNPISTYDNVARDTYFFRTDNDHAYFIIGDEGRMRSYRYDNGNWRDNGNFYDFQPGESGFTEMPNVTRLPNGKWLMTYTPYTGNVRCLYRIGDIDGNGRFVNFTQSELFDFYANDGFCLMSPSIGVDKNGNPLALGIVADKMPTEWNISHGYAHLYSLPRQLGVDAEGRLTQKPFDGHEAMRGTVSKVIDSPMTLDGAMSLNPVRGRQAEVCAVFKVGDSSFGLNFLKDAKGRGGSLTYNPATCELKLDVRRLVGEGYGMKEASFRLPVAPAKGEEFKLHVFIDHSVMDVFVNDRYATSFRVFPENMGHDLIEVFSNGPTTLQSLEAYLLGEGYMSDEPGEVTETLESSGRVAMYVGYANADELAANPQEKKAYEYFIESYPMGRVIYSGDYTDISASDFDMVWVNCDRRGLQAGWNNLPEAFSNTGFVNTLKTYSAAGGNLLLTKFATQLVTAIGRTDDTATGVFSSGDGSFKDDEWAVNLAHHDTDWADCHIMFSGLPVVEAPYGKLLVLMSGAHHREDHNCMWDLNGLGGHDAFCARNDADVLGTWGHDGGQEWGGIVEFHPRRQQQRATSADVIEARRGTVITVGLAAYEWAESEGTNLSHGNIRALTDNMIKYLSPVKSIPSSVTEIDTADDAEVMYFNLQGVRVDNPSNGVFVRVSGGKAVKVRL